MSELSACLADYLALRRSLGYKLETSGAHLANFVAELDAQGISHIRTEQAMAWATRPPDASPRWRASRLGMVRCFARYAQALDSAHEVPPTWLLPRGRRGPAPYLYSETEIATLMVAARGPRSPLRASTLSTVIGLLAVSGIRVGEALRLNRRDVDVDQRALLVLNSKAGKSRVVPLLDSTITALESFSAQRDELCPLADPISMFVSTKGSACARPPSALPFPRCCAWRGFLRVRVGVVLVWGTFAHFCREDTDPLASRGSRS